jgi:hypothetical protein
MGFRCASRRGTNLRREVVDEAAEPEMPDDSDDGRRPGVADVHHESLSDRASAWPQEPRQFVVDDHNGGFRIAVVIREQAALDELYAECLEQARGNRPRVSHRRVGSYRSFEAVRKSPVRQVVVRNVAERAHARNAGKRRNLVQELADERLARHERPERQLPLGAETWIDPQHFDEGAHQQHGADQQHDAHRDLPDDQGGARAITHGRRRRPPMPLE